MLQNGHLEDVLRASYERVLVDEYQDCSGRQHAMICALSEVLPTCVVGDPMQAIFGFGSDQLADWEGEVCARFPIHAELSTPWRWINAGAPELGEWLLEARRILVGGGSIDLSDAPPSVRWIELEGRNDHTLLLKAARTRAPSADGRVLIIADSRNKTAQRNFASQTPGAVTVEAVDLRDLVDFATEFDIESPRALIELVSFAQTTMSGLTSPRDFVKRVELHAQGKARTPPTEPETLALAFHAAPSLSSAADVLVALSRQGGVRIHRPVVQRACLRAMTSCQQMPGTSFRDSALRTREEYRATGRTLPRRAVGSTLLLKGLEAEAVVVLEAARLDRRNLYVAMTRGSQLVVVCSASAVLPPRAGRR